MTSAGATGGMSLVDSALNNTMTPSESQILPTWAGEAFLFSLCLHWWKRPWGECDRPGGHGPSSVAKSTAVYVYHIYTVGTYLAR
jgi:hypothetical protein